MSTGFQLTDDLRAFGVEQLHADLYKGLLPFGKTVQKSQGLFAGSEIAGDNDVTVHFLYPPIISLSFSMPSRSISRGSCSMISLQA